MSQVKITKDQVIPFIDISETIGTTTWTPSWKRIDMSTVFDLAFNPQSEDINYISQKLPTTEVTEYKPELPQEIKLYRGNDIYDFIEGLCQSLPVGNALTVPFLLAWPPTAAATPVIRGWQVKQATILLNNYNSVDGKISFNIKLGGDIEQGTISITSAGVPTFTADT